MSFKDFNADTKKTVQSNLNQVIDIIQEDISGSATRRKYQTFVTGGVGPGVTSSLYQTIYDQDFTLQTANPVIDMTVGLFHSDDGTTKRENLVTQGTGYSLSTTTGQLLFNSSATMMMREKINIYRQYANYLLGDPNAAFILDAENYPSSAGKAGFNVTTDVTVIDAALFVNVKRLFSRDGIRKETFAIRLYEHAPDWDDTVKADSWTYNYSASGTTISKVTPSSNAAPLDNLFGNNTLSSEDGVQIIADLTAAQNFKSDNAAGDVALLRLASDSTVLVGLLFYQAGIAVLNLGGSTVLAGSNHPTGPSSNNTGGENLDVGLGQLLTGTNTIKPIFDPRDQINGVIDGMSNTSLTTTNWNNGTPARANRTAAAGQVFIGKPHANKTDGPAISNRQYTGMGYPATFYPDLLVSASIDNIIDHIGATRFSSGSLTAMAFQNQTKINSSIYFCRASANEFNTSSNPTFLDDDGVPVMIQDADNDKPFTYITTVALADSKGDVVAIAKLNRPIEKNDESELTIRVRLDF